MRACASTCACACRYYKVPQLASKKVEEAERVFVKKKLGACRQQTPRGRADLEAPKGVFRQDLSDATLEFVAGLDIRRRHAPEKKGLSALGPSLKRSFSTQ